VLYGLGRVLRDVNGGELSNDTERLLRASCIKYTQHVLLTHDSNNNNNNNYAGFLPICQNRIQLSVMQSVIWQQWLTN